MQLYHIKKYGDEIPIQVRDQEHLDSLVAIHGEGSIVRPDGQTVAEYMAPIREKVEREIAEEAKRQLAEEGQ